ncbi:unnamed protein product, partial [Choristocarpus tenellus]
VHDDEAARKKERDQEAVDGGIDGMVIMPPKVQLERRWLVSTGYRAEFLPVMDAGVVGVPGSGGGDFFFQVCVCLGFGGG